VGGAGGPALLGCLRPTPVRKGSSGNALDASRGMIMVDTHAPPPGLVAVNAGVAGYRMRCRRETVAPQGGGPLPDLPDTELCGAGGACHRWSGRCLANQPGACRKVRVWLPAEGAGL